MARITASLIKDRMQREIGYYVMGGTGPEQWDCSGFVGRCCGAAYGQRLFITGSEGQWLGQHGFKDVSDEVDLRSGAGMKKGDILIYNKPQEQLKEGQEYGSGASGHTEIYWAEGKTMGARGPSAEKAANGVANGVGMYATPGGHPGGGLIYVWAHSYTWQECWRPPGGLEIKEWWPA